MALKRIFEWLLREDSPGIPLGERRNLNLELMPKLIKMIFEISKISPSFIPGIKKFKIKNYLAERFYQYLVKRGVGKRGSSFSREFH